MIIHTLQIKIGLGIVNGSFTVIKSHDHIGRNLRENVNLFASLFVDLTLRFLQTSQ